MKYIAEKVHFVDKRNYVACFNFRSYRKCLVAVVQYIVVGKQSKAFAIFLLKVLFWFGRK